MDVEPPPVIPVRLGEDVSCDPGTNDAASEPSACEETSSSKANVMDSTSGTEDHVDTAAVQLGPSETLDLRIFCGTWNVAGRDTPCGRCGSVHDDGVLQRVVASEYGIAV